MIAPVALTTRFAATVPFFSCRIRLSVQLAMLLGLLWAEVFLLAFLRSR